MRSLLSLFLSFSIFIFAGSLIAENKPAVPASTDFERSFSFGHVGADFTIFHNFRLVNSTGQPFRILKAVSSCDCSAVLALNSEVMPDDTAVFRLSFSTRNDFGPVSKSVTVTTDHPATPSVAFTYTAVIEQWYNGLKPSSTSLFFLPGKNSQTIRIPNREFSSIRASLREQFDNAFEVTIVKSAASRNEALELVVSPRADLGKGTYLSSFSVLIDKEPTGDPTILTIPVKIVRY
ncbi:MAG TPA: DUF1573 domain-containing protein [Candidatus Deferrimicrobium sp.]|nr:DUF1573 domain-containing protein [Candidatus Deferrimicrobium sp.]